MNRYLRLTAAAVSALALAGCGSMVTNQPASTPTQFCGDIWFVSSYPHDRDSRGYEPGRSRSVFGMDGRRPAGG